MIKAFEHSLLICNRALMGQPSHLYNRLGDLEDKVMAGISRRADRYQQIINRLKGELL